MNQELQEEPIESAWSEKPTCCCTNGHRPWKDDDGLWWVSFNMGCRVHAQGKIFTTKDGKKL
jgi:hypothetical protein